MNLISEIIEEDEQIFSKKKKNNQTTNSVQYLTKKQKEKIKKQEIKEKEIQKKKNLEKEKEKQKRNHESNSHYRSSRSRNERDREYERERDRDRDRYRYRDRHNERDRNRERGRYSNRNDRGYDPNQRKMSKNEETLSRLEELKKKEEKELQQQYLVGRKKITRRHRRIKNRERGRIKMDWDPSEDTSEKDNVLFKDSQNISMLFGTGLRAGIDPMEQFRHNKRKRKSKTFRQDSDSPSDFEYADEDKISQSDKKTRTNKESNRKKERERSGDKNRNSDKKERERGGDRNGKRERDKKRERERNREKKERDRERRREKEKEKNKEREKERERKRGREREREREREKERDIERERERKKDREKHRNRKKYQEKEKEIEIEKEKGRKRKTKQKRLWAERVMNKDQVHWSEKSREDMNARDWRIFREDHQLVCYGGNVPNPLRFWDEANISKKLLRSIKEAGYKKPFAIQCQAIPVGLQNRDSIGIAKTGSGKTAAFLIPMLVYVSRLPKMTMQIAQNGPYALTLVPTRELAQQIEKEANKFCKSLGLRAYSIVGGNPIEEQAIVLRNGVEILIATPGRLKDCLERQYLVLNQCNYVVLDEADRMINLGFEDKVIDILDAMPVQNLRPLERVSKDGDEDEDMDLEQKLIDYQISVQRGYDLNKDKKKNILDNNDSFFLDKIKTGKGKRRSRKKKTEEEKIKEAESSFKEISEFKYRQTFMFTATMSTSLERIAKKFLRSPVIIRVGDPGTTVNTIKQTVLFIKKTQKNDNLFSILSQFEPPMIVFVNTVNKCENITYDLENRGYKPISIHGKKTQNQREGAIRKFKEGFAHVLVATDVASRGLDIEDVTLVVNYDMPNSIDTYTHRIGRTARAGKRGEAYTLLTKEDNEMFYDLRNMLHECNERVPSELENHPDAIVKPGTFRSVKN
ncbi:hypothetical protein M0812_25992 [Anaeramoeba flamelloides]|uniref:RNA helicase n=1 Tax=Anaeramoeba flamelloides TaxID=1746091 RepID=A0AAV7YI66_9EUKA|nr:hypothetical protein M0812_25992 [Anaeramoeba flamelloides]